MKYKRSMAAQEARLAFGMLATALVIVFSIVLLPMLINLWVSFKNIRLGDLRAPIPIVREKVTYHVDQETGITNVKIEYRARNSSRNNAISNVVLTDTLPANLTVQSLDTDFSIKESVIHATLGDWASGYAHTYTLYFSTSATAGRAIKKQMEQSKPILSAKSVHPIATMDITLNNYKNVLRRKEFFSSLVTTIIYTVCGASGALFFGLCAALLVRKKFFASGIVRGLFLFPYIAPIVAVTFVWVFLLDPLSGPINEALKISGVTEHNISFLSSKPVALISVIFFDAWRYFPFAYLFILARLQSIPAELYESAMMDGAGTFRLFWNITLPQLRTVIGTIFVLRFIWTFNRFDDIFLLTGGASGTRTLPVEVYNYAFATGDIGTGAATAVLLFLFLMLFFLIYTRAAKQEQEG